MIQAKLHQQTSASLSLQLCDSVLRSIRYLYSKSATSSFKTAERHILRITYLTNPETRATFPEHIHAQMGQEIHNYVQYGLDPEDQVIQDDTDQDSTMEIDHQIASSENNMEVDDEYFHDLSTRLSTSPYMDAVSSDASEEGEYDTAVPRQCSTFLHWDNICKRND